MKKIQLLRGGEALVDDEDYERVRKHKWYLVQSKSGGKYANAVIKAKDGGYPTGKAINIHRFILNLTRSKIQVDHKDRDGLNNQKCNLRKCTPQQNCFNTAPNRSNKTSKYKGVRKATKLTFAACISLNYKTYNLGRYKKEKDAAVVYDAVARYYMGEFAYTNFDKEYIKPLSIENLKEKLRQLKKTVKVVDTTTNEEVFRGTFREVLNKYNLTSGKLHSTTSGQNNNIRDNLKYTRINYKIKINYN